ncbi:MAG: CinA family protein [Ilumatobacteraceae bacterium]
MPGSVPSSGHRSSGSTTRRWSRWCSTCCASGVCPGAGRVGHRRSRRARLTGVAGASDVFVGSIVSYASRIKFELLGVPDRPVVCEASAVAMAEGARRVLGADVRSR